MEDRGWKSGIKKYAVGILCFVAVVLMGRGLLHSYSRGAWLATVCGMAYLVWTLKRGNAHLTQAINTRHLIRPAATFSPSDAEKDAQSGEGESLSCDTSFPWLNKNWLSLSAILLSVVVLFFWHFRQTTWHPARRALSAVNAVDFSWRNRIAAWEGALQITAEHPWFGTGWNQPEPLYEHYYLPQKLTESAAIQMNDYLMLGATLGIPALFCFGMYLWLSLTTNSGARISNIGRWTLDFGLAASDVPRRRNRVVGRFLV